jgi:hypothetical protein
MGGGDWLSAGRGGANTGSGCCDVPATTGRWGVSAAEARDSAMTRVLSGARYRPPEKLSLSLFLGNGHSETGTGTGCA